MSRRKSDEVPEEPEPESSAVVKGLLEDIIGEVVKEREESENWERLMSTSTRQLNDADARSRSPLYSEADETDSDGCFDDRRRLPYDFCTRVATDYDYSSATTTSDDESAAAPSAVTGAKQIKKSRGSSGAFSRAAYVNRRRKRKRPPMTLEVALAKRRVAVEMLGLNGKREAEKLVAVGEENDPPPSSEAADDIGERQLALAPLGFVEDEFSPLAEGNIKVEVKEEVEEEEEVLGRGKRLRRANSRYSDDATPV